jgi:hypothetical protein
MAPLGLCLMSVDVCNWRELTLRSDVDSRSLTRGDRLRVYGEAQLLFTTLVYSRYSTVEKRL